MDILILVANRENDLMLRGQISLYQEAEAIRKHVWRKKHYSVIKQRCKARKAVTHNLAQLTLQFHGFIHRFCG